MLIKHYFEIGCLIVFEVAGVVYYKMYAFN